MSDTITTESAVETVLAYHRRTKHSLKAYARGPETLDWDAQPNPFREFAGAPRTALSMPAGALDTPFADLHMPGAVASRSVTVETLGLLLRHSFGLAAWKEYGPDRWALRCNPSSGNLHPTEAYAVVRNVEGLGDGIYHYLPRDHALEKRCACKMEGDDVAALWIGLSSIYWREAWKYGERALRYCLLDAGHALGALSYAAAALGWRPLVVETAASREIASLLGLDRVDDFAWAEKEEPDLLVAIWSGESNASPTAPECQKASWFGTANLLDPHPMYRWPVIDQAIAATRGRGAACRAEAPEQPDLVSHCTMQAGDLILQRRSAQRFDARTPMPAASFFHMLDCLLPRAGVPPFDVWQRPARVHPLLFVHRVEGIEPGVYILPRRPGAEADLREMLLPRFEWAGVEGAPPHLPLYRLVSGDNRHIARAISCHQWIASDGCFSLGMLSEFDAAIRANAHAYRQLHHEAGLIGHVLYLEAEAAGFRGTGIGCFMDDDFHKAIGLTDDAFQSLYHFTVGLPKTDGRISTLPAYPAA